MNRLIKAVWVGCLVILLVACAPARQQPEIQLQSATDHFRQGLAQFQRWEQNKDDSLLFDAELQLSKAATEYADNAEWQTRYYQVLYLLCVIDWGFWHVRLEQHFSSLNTLVKREFNPPELLHYLLVENALDFEQKQRMLNKALVQQPHSYLVWWSLSLLYGDANHLEMALYAAKTAGKFSKNAAGVSFQIGALYDQMAHNRSCIYSVPQLTRASVKHLAKAVAQEPDNKGYQEYLASIYNSLGLFPLSMQIANKARGIEESQWNLQELAIAQFGMGDFRAAETNLDKLLMRYGNIYAYEMLLAVAIAEGNWEQAAGKAGGMLQAEPNNLYYQLMYSWVVQIAGLDSEVFQSVSTDTSWEKTLIKYRRDWVVSPDLLLEQAANRCQMSEAHFYTAMRLWQQDKLDQARSHLRQVLEQKAYNNREYAWASAMLSSLFEASSS